MAKFGALDTLRMFSNKIIRVRFFDIIASVF